jgi:hypothetical protein
MRPKDASKGTDAPRWANVMAALVPLCVLPSAAWRLHHGVYVMVAGPGPCGVQTTGEALYVASLSGVTLSLALLTLGLVRPWGQVLPSWLPGLGGAVVPRLLATGAAALVAMIAGLLTGYYLLKEALNLQLVQSRPLPPGCTAPGFDVLIYYVPLLAWAPLLAILTVRYDRHRRRLERSRDDEASSHPHHPSQRSLSANRSNTP